MTGYADLEIGLHRRDAENYGVELRFIHPDGDAKVSTLRVNETNGRVSTLGEYQVRFDDATGESQAYPARVFPGILIYVVVDINSEAACDASHLEIEID